MSPLPEIEYQYPAAGTPRGGLAIVGEAPGAEEVRQNKPFVGASGRLLNEGLAAAGIDRAACFVGNVFRRQPPGNKVGHFFASRGRARKEGLEIVEALGPLGTSDYVLADYAGDIDCLTAALREIAPTAILALGRTPLWALTGESAITRLRGQVLDCRLVPGAVVIPTFHPSYLLRGQRREEPTFRADIALALRHSRSGAGAAGP